MKENPELPGDDSRPDAYWTNVRAKTDARETWDTARAYAALGMIEDAEACLRTIPPESGERYLAAQLGLCRIYHGQHRNEEIVQIGQRMIAEGRYNLAIVESTMLALTFLGRNREARETLALVERLGQPLARRAYQMACFASLEGDCSEALRWLEIEARNPRHLTARSIGDSDLLPLWEWLARGPMTLEDAHRLLSFRLWPLCREALAPGATVQMDQNDLKTQPPEFRRLFRFNQGSGLSELDAVAVSRHPADAEAFRQARRTHLERISGFIEDGYRRGLALVADAQPGYAVEQAAAGNVLGVRYHLTWALAYSPEKLAAFRAQPGLHGMEALFEGFERVLAVDPWLCRRCYRVLDRAGRDLDDAWRMLEETPQAARWHPLFILHRALLCIMDADDRAALPLLRQVIEAWPNDPGGYGNAATVLMNLERWDEAATMLREAPECYRRFRLYRDQQRRLAERRPRSTHNPPPTGFRGQRDLGDILLPEDEAREIQL